MSVSRDELVQPESISEILICPVCMDVLKEPVFFSGRPCQHVFCKSCIETCLDERSQCPVCRGDVQDQQPQPHLAIGGLLDELVIRCEHSCGWTGRSDMRPQHRLQCPVALLETARHELETATSQVAALRAQVSTQEVELVRRGQECESLRMESSSLRSQLHCLEHQRSLNASLTAENTALQNDCARTQSEVNRLRDRLASCQRGRQEIEAEVLDKMRSWWSDCPFAERLGCNGFSTPRSSRSCAAADRNQSFQIFFKPHAGRVIAVSIEGSSTLETALVALEAASAFSGEALQHFHFTFNGKLLNGSTTLSEYGICEASTIKLVPIAPAGQVHQDATNGKGPREEPQGGSSELPEVGSSGWWFGKG